jgi:hypothetical protein
MSTKEIIVEWEEVRTIANTISEDKGHCISFVALVYSRWCRESTSNNVERKRRSVKAMVEDMGGEREGCQGRGRDGEHDWEVVRKDG